MSVCLTSVAYIRSAGGVCGWPAAWRVLADRARLGSAGLVQGCRCALPLKTWAGTYRGGRPPTACLSQKDTTVSAKSAGTAFRRSKKVAERRSDALRLNLSTESKSRSVCIFCCRTADVRCKLRRTQSVARCRHAPTLRRLKSSATVLRRRRPHTKNHRRLLDPPRRIELRTSDSYTRPLLLSIESQSPVTSVDCFAARPVA